MENLILIIITIGITWFSLDKFVYGYKAQIKKLWKEIFRYAQELAKWEKAEKELGHVVASGFFFALRKRKNRAGKLINALLDYHYADTEDEDEQEYVKDNRYEEKPEK